MKRSNNNKNVGKPITDEFILFLAENRDFAVNYLMKNNPGLSREDCEDIYGLFLLQFLEKRETLGDSARRFVELTRPNLISRLRWFTIYFLRRRNNQKHGGNIPHVAINESLHKLTALTSVLSEEFELSEVAENLLSALSEVFQSCGEKQLAVARALGKWLEAGCPSESWTDFLLPEEVEEFMKLKKGLSLEGKASPAFCAVKKMLKEILVREGLREGLSA